MKPQKLKNIIFIALALFAFAAAAFAQTETPADPAPAEQKTETPMSEGDRLPFMQTEQTLAPEEPSSGALFARTLGAMILIVGLIFVGAWGLKKLGFGTAKAGSEDAPDLTILSSVSLGSGRTISTVKFGERILLVGSTAQSFTLLADESDADAEEKFAPRSVAEMLADESGSFANELAQAERKFSFADDREERS